MRTRLPIIALALLIVLLVAGRQVQAAFTAAVYLARLVPESPFAELPGPELIREGITFSHGDEVLAGEVVRPRDGLHPGLVLVLGLEPDPEDPGLRRTLDATARMGLAVLMPYIGTLGLAREDPGQAAELFLASGARAEPAAPLVDAFEYLRGQPYVKDGRAGFMGFSAGASLSAIAAADPRIRNRVAFLHWFGGYNSAEDTVRALLTGQVLEEGGRRSWSPAPWATERVRRAVVGIPSEDEEEAGAIGEFLAGFPGDKAGAFERLSPQTYAGAIRAPTFVLHDTGDTFIPPVESRHFWEGLPPASRADYTEVALFDHVTIQSPRDLGAFCHGMIRLIGHLSALLLTIG